MNLITIAGGLLPVAVFAYLFRGSLGTIIPELAPIPANSRTDGPRLVPLTRPVLVEPLSERELEVLSLIERGKLNKEIAQELSVTLGTVKTHTNNINGKLGTRSRTQAVAIARQLELLYLPSTHAPPSGGGSSYPLLASLDAGRPIWLSTKNRGSKGDEECVLIRRRCIPALNGGGMSGRVAGRGARGAG